MPLRAADFESAAYAIPPLRAGPKCRRACAAGNPGSDARRLAPGPMLDSPGLRIAVRRDPPIVEDLRSTTVSDDPVQRRDLILLERAREGDLDAFNDLVTLYQDQLFALVVRMVPDRDQASDCVQEAFFSAFRNLTLVPWRERQVVAQPDLRQRGDGHAAGPQAPARPALSRARRRELAAAGRRRRPTRSGRRSTVGADARSCRPRWPTITDDQRAAIVLYDVEGYDYAEIAEMTGVSLGTVKSRIHRGRLALRDAPRGPHGAVPWLTSTPPTTSIAGREPARRRPAAAPSGPRPRGRSRDVPHARRSTRSCWPCPRPPRRSPAPARTRDFRLTAADAARLAASRAEPVTASARPVVDMRTTTDHATHDLERLSAAVDGTLPAADRPSADAQLAACDRVRRAPRRPAGARRRHTALCRHPARPRDFQLTDADASRLQRGGLRGWSRADRVPEGPPLPSAGRRPDDARPRRRAGRDRPIRRSRRSAARPGPRPRPRAPPRPRRARSWSARGPTARPVPPRARLPPRARRRRRRAPRRRPLLPSTRPDSRTRPRRLWRRRPDGSRPTAAARRATWTRASNGIDQGVAQPELAAPSPGASSFETLSSSPSTDGGPSLILVLSVAALLAGIALFVLRSGARRRHG